MPLVDALEVLTEEGRFYDDEIIGERFLTLWSGGVRMGKPNSAQNGTNLVMKWFSIYRKSISSRWGTWWTETSK